MTCQRLRVGLSARPSCPSLSWCLWVGVVSLYGWPPPHTVLPGDWATSFTSFTRPPISWADWPWPALWSQGCLVTLPAPALVGGPWADSWVGSSHPPWWTSASGCVAGHLERERERLQLTPVNPSFCQHCSKNGLAPGRRHAIFLQQCWFLIDKNMRNNFQ